MSSDRFADERAARRSQEDVREEVSNALLQRLDVIVADAAAVFPSSADQPLDPDYNRRLAESLVRLLAAAVRDAAIDDRGVLLATLRSALLERSVRVEQLFTFAYLTERTALDDLASDHAIGASSEAWPLVGQLVRRGSFDFLASIAARARLEPANATTDPLTTLHTRAMLDTVLLKETERTGRFGYPLALILFDLDRLTSINEQHGYGVGTKILERLGVLMRKYFRQHDWVARHGDDEIAVLLTGADAGHASDLAERARKMVEERLVFTDHRTGKTATVTVTAAVVMIAGEARTVVDPERLLVAAEAALKRAKQAGRNRVETVNDVIVNRTLPRSSPSA
jgi:diguanylate cyclase (GGDEF)-like protein